MRSGVEPPGLRHAVSLLLYRAYTSVGRSEDAARMLLDAMVVTPQYSFGDEGLRRLAIALCKCDGVRIVDEWAAGESDEDSLAALAVARWAAGQGDEAKGLLMDVARKDGLSEHWRLISSFQSPRLGIQPDMAEAFCEAQLVEDPDNENARERLEKLRLEREEWQEWEQ